MKVITNIRLFIKLLIIVLIIECSKIIHLKNKKNYSKKQLNEKNSHSFKTKINASSILCI